MPAPRRLTSTPIRTRPQRGGMPRPLPPVDQDRQPAAVVRLESPVDALVLLGGDDLGNERRQAKAAAQSQPLQEAPLVELPQRPAVPGGCARRVLEAPAQREPLAEDGVDQGRGVEDWLASPV